MAGRCAPADRIRQRGRCGTQDVRRGRLTRLFQAFQAHYGFGYAFRNPYPGHEKGAVETRGGAVRRGLFVPVPSVWNIEGFNRRLPERCLELGDRTHYRKGGNQTDLFAEDRKALLPLPAKRFDVVTWTRMKADKYGNVILEGRHRYAAGPEYAGREMIVGLRALEIEILDAEGRHVITHQRAYGERPTSSTDPSGQLELLCVRPAAWSNSRVRDALPDPLREWIDAQDETTRRASLQTLRHADRESGWEHAVAGMLEILESTGGTDRAGVFLVEAGRASGLTAIDYDDPVDLNEYDIAYTKEDA